MASTTWRSRARQKLNRNRGHTFAIAEKAAALRTE